MDKLHDILKLLGLSFPERKVYLSLLKQGSATARTLSLRTGITRTSIYDQLKLLIQIGLVVERDLDDVSTYTASDTKMVSRLLEERQEEIEKGKKDVGALLSAIATHEEGSTPKIRFVEGGENIARVLYELLFVGGKEIKTVWPYAAMHDVLGEAFLRKFNAERKRKCIRLQTLWPKEGKQVHTIWDAEDRADKTVERRFAPKGFCPRMSYTICGNKVLCVSSQKEMFGFVVESTEFAELMCMQFAVLWASAR